MAATFTTENSTMNLPCRTVFSAGQKTIEVIGSVPEVEDEIAALHQNFWRHTGHVP